MAESLPHRGATLWGSSYCHCSREAQPTERFYKSVRTRSQVHRYKTLYLWWLRSTIHRKNRPCRSFEDPQEVGSETGAHTSSSIIHHHFVPFRSYRSSSKYWTLWVYEPPLGGLGTTYDVPLGLIGNRVVDFLLVLSELFSLSVTAEAQRVETDRKSVLSLQHSQFDPKFRVEGVAPTNTFGTDS